MTVHLMHLFVTKLTHVRPVNVVCTVPESEEDRNGPRRPRPRPTAGPFTTQPATRLACVRASLDLEWIDGFASHHAPDGTRCHWPTDEWTVGDTARTNSNFVSRSTADGSTRARFRLNFIWGSTVECRVMCDAYHAYLCAHPNPI